MAVQQIQQSSIQETSFRKIKFQDELPQLRIQNTSPPTKLSRPSSILKKRNFSFQEKESEVVGNCSSTLPRSFSLQLMPIDQKKISFGIQSAPKVQHQLFLQIQKNNEIKKTAETQSIKSNENEVVQSQPPRKKIPIWAFVFIGFLIFLTLGWIVSKCIFPKTKNQVEQQNAYKNQININSLKKFSNQPSQQVNLKIQHNIVNKVGNMSQKKHLKRIY